MPPLAKGARQKSKELTFSKLTAKIKIAMKDKGLSETEILADFERAKKACRHLQPHSPR